jgi:hypothetical protein
MCYAVAMASALLLALLFAQAEAAPPEPPPPPLGPAEPAPAEPAPAAPAADVVEVEPPPPHLIGLSFGGGRRLAPAGTDVPPTFGLAVATILGRRYLLLGDRLELGLAFHFGFQRYARDVTITLMTSGQPSTFEDVRTLTYYDLAILHTFSLPLAGGRVRPFAALGGGVTLAHFSTLEPELSPGEARATKPIVRAAVGLDVAVAGPENRVGLELDHAWVFQAPALTTRAGGAREVFGDRLGLNLWARHAF